MSCRNSSSCRVITICLLVLLLNISYALAAANRQPVDPDRLPWTAQKFIRTNMWTCVPLYAYRDNKGYEVYMNDNSVARFDFNGKWKQVNCTEGVPDKILPVNIRVYLVNRFPHYNVIWVKRLPQSYQLELSNGLRLVFNKSGKFVKLL